MYSVCFNFFVNWALNYEKMNTQDQLWKAVIEEFFTDLLELFYPSLIPQIDFTKDFDFLDKDLPKFFPEAEEINRKADRIVKVPLKNGGSQWIIIHIEVQGYKDTNFARRMFTYYYRLADRFDVPITALVIYSDNNQENRVSKYEAKSFNTRLLYEFDTYVIADHKIEEYEAMNNPFAIIFQTALMGIKGNKKDEELLEMKLQLFRKLLEKGYNRKQIQRLATFIKEYVRFSKSDFLRKFDKRSEEFSKNRESMGIIETVIKYRSEEASAIAREQGIEQGFEQGFELKDKLLTYLKDTEFKIATIIRPLKKGFSIADTATLLDIEEIIVTEFNKLISPIEEKLLKRQFKKIKAKFSPDYSLEMLQTDIISLLLAVKFSEKTISKLLKCRLSLVKKINKNRKK